MQRETKVYYENDWPWPGKPWPWCHMAEFVDVELNHHPAIPHDAHKVNEGNTWCPGVPGIVDVPDPVIKRFHNKDRMAELVDWLVSLDDPEGPGFEARRTVTLNQIIEKARKTYVERKV